MKLGDWTGKPETLTRPVAEIKAIAGVDARRRVRARRQRAKSPACMLGAAFACAALNSLITRSHRFAQKKRAG